MRLLLSLSASSALLFACSLPSSVTGSGRARPTPHWVDMLCSSDIPAAEEAYNRAWDSFDRGDLDQAEQLYGKAIELDPGFCDAMDNLGLLLRQEGRLDEAISWYKASLEVLPSNATALQNLAGAYQVRGDTQNAINSFEALIELDPQNPEGYYGLGNLYSHLGRAPDSVPYLETALQLYDNPGSPRALDAHYLLGLALYTTEDCLNAVPHLEAGYDHFEEDPDVNYALGYCYLTPEFNDTESARVFLKKAESLGVDIPSELEEFVR